MIELKIKGNKSNLEVFINNNFRLELVSKDIFNLMATKLEQSIVEIKTDKVKNKKTY